MGRPKGAPDFNDCTQFEFSSTTTSGLLTADETYRISTNADCMIGFGEVHDEGFLLSNGCFLGADQEMFVDISDNTKWMWVISDVLTTSGIATATRWK